MHVRSIKNRTRSKDVLGGILRRVDQLDTMVFGHFKYAARHFMTSK